MGGKHSCFQPVSCTRITIVYPTSPGHRDPSVAANILTDAVVSTLGLPSNYIFQLWGIEPPSEAAFSSQSQATGPPSPSPSVPSPFVCVFTPLGHLFFFFPFCLHILNSILEAGIARQGFCPTPPLVLSVPRMRGHCQVDKVFQIPGSNCFISRNEEKGHKNRNLGSNVIASFSVCKYLLSFCWSDTFHLHALASPRCSPFRYARLSCRAGGAAKQRH